MRRWMQMIAVTLLAALLGTTAAESPGIVSRASEFSGEEDPAGEEQTGGEQTGEEEKPESEMTEKEKAEKAAKEAREKEIKETYELPVQSNKVKGWPKGPGTYGAAGIVMDVDSGVILYAKNIDAHEYPASITKVLTALLAFQYGDMNSEVTISQDALSCLGSGYASIGLKEGNVISLEQAMYAMLLASANEVAYAVGENIAQSQGQDYDWFISQMNEKCEELGGENSNFINTNGVFDEDHYTCARDMALIGKALFEYPMFLQICQTQQFMIPASDTVEEHVFQQKHRMLLWDNEDYYQYAVAGKTGYTTEAENTLITLADNGERRLVCVVLKTYGGHLYSDTRALLDYGFKNFKNEFVREHDEDMEFERIEGDACVLLPKGVDFDELDRELVFHEDGRDDATVTYFYKDMPVGTCEVTVSGGYYNNRKTDKNEESEEEPEKEDNDENQGEWYKAAVAIGIAMIIALCVIMTVIVTNIFRKRKEKRRRR